MSEKREERDVLVGKNLTTGKPYFERKKVPVPDPTNPPEEPPSQEPSPMYPTTKPPREDVPMGGVPKGDRE